MRSYLKISHLQTLAVYAAISSKCRNLLKTALQRSDAPQTMSF